MAGRGGPPKDDEERRRRNAPVHGWQFAPGTGWQHGEIPKPPAKLTAAAREAWRVWFGSWFAAFWGPDHVPALRQVIRLYNAVEKGEFQRHGELRIAMDTYGITPKGQQDRRWRPARLESEASAAGAASGTGGQYGHLRSVAPSA